MKHILRMTTAAALLCLLITACAKPVVELYGNEPKFFFDEYSELVEYVDLHHIGELWQYDDFVQVEVLAQEENVEAYYTHRLPDATIKQWVVYTDYTVRVQDVLRGDLEIGQELHVKRLGGESPDGWSYRPLREVGSYIMRWQLEWLEVGKTYILMLEDDPRNWGSEAVPKKNIDPSAGMHLLVEDGNVQIDWLSDLPEMEYQDGKMDAEEYKQQIRAFISEEEAAYAAYLEQEVTAPVLAVDPEESGAVYFSDLDEQCGIRLAFEEEQSCSEEYRVRTTIKDKKGNIQTEKMQRFVPFSVDGALDDVRGEYFSYFTLIECDDERIYNYEMGNVERLVLKPDTEYEVTFEFYSKAFSETVGPRLLGTQTLTVRTCSQAELDAAKAAAEVAEAGGE